MFIAHRQFQLGQGPGSLGLNCEPGGVSLAGVPLLRQTEVGFEPRLVGELHVIAKAAYGGAFDAVALRRGLFVAAQALNDNDLSRAMMATLHLRLPDLDADGASRVAAVDAVLAKYSPEQPRDWHGRWTTEGGGSAPSRPSALRSQGAAPPDSSRVDRPVGGHLVEVRYQPPEGDNGPPAEPVGERGPEADPTAEPAEILRILPPERGTNPTMIIFVARDHIGPMLIGSDDKEEYEQPPGYDRVRLVGAPQVTYSSGPRQRTPSRVQSRD